MSEPADNIFIAAAEQVPAIVDTLRKLLELEAPTEDQLESLKGKLSSLDATNREAALLTIFLDHTADEFEDLDAPEPLITLEMDPIFVDNSDAEKVIKWLELSPDEVREVLNVPLGDLFKAVTECEPRFFDHNFVYLETFVAGWSKYVAVEGVQKRIPEVLSCGCVVLQERLNEPTAQLFGPDKEKGYWNKSIDKILDSLNLEGEAKKSAVQAAIDAIPEGDRGSVVASVKEYFDIS